MADVKVDPYATKLSAGDAIDSVYGLLVASLWPSDAPWVAQHAAWSERLREADAEGCLYAMPAHTLHTTVATLTYVPIPRVRLPPRSRGAAQRGRAGAPRRRAAAPGH
jgi:hypothetical protein